MIPTISNYFKILCLIYCLPVWSYGQNNTLAIFDKLVDKSWEAKGNWSNGQAFYQEITFHSILQGKAITTTSKGYIDHKQTLIGQRNHGIRQFDENTKQVHFWEFDIYGGRTEGIVFEESNKLIYQYTYQGLELTDMWEPVNDTTYNFTVGDYRGGKWHKKYLRTQFKLVSEKSSYKNE